MTRHRPTLLCSALVALALGASCSSNTTQKIKSFADEVCACKDAACALAVQESYLVWWKENQRARGSEGDRKDIEKAMQRYAECHQRLVGAEAPVPAVRAPNVDLSPPPPSRPDENSSGDEAADPKDPPAPGTPEGQSGIASPPSSSSPGGTKTDPATP